MYYLICIFVCRFYSSFGQINNKTYSAFLLHHMSSSRSSLAFSSSSSYHVKYTDHFPCFPQINAHLGHGSMFHLVCCSSYPSAYAIHNQFWAFNNEIDCNLLHLPSLQPSLCWTDAFNSSSGRISTQILIIHAFKGLNICC